MIVSPAAKRLLRLLREFQAPVTAREVEAALRRLVRQRRSKPLVWTFKNGARLRFVGNPGCPVKCASHPLGEDYAGSFGFLLVDGPAPRLYAGFRYE